MTEALPAECKPLLHRMTGFSGTAFHPPSSILINPHHDPKPTACHLHVNPSNPWHHYPVHCGTRAPQSMALTASYDGSSFRTSSACSPHHLDYEAEGFREDGNGKSFRERDDGKSSWSEAQQPENDELKKACEKLCEQMQWKAEKQYQKVARSSFWGIGQCQAALHDESRRRDFRGATTGNFHEENHGYLRHRCDRDHLSLGQSQSSFSDATFARPFRECCKERPVSAPIHERIITSPGRRSIVPEELLQRYSESARPHVLTGVNGACKEVVPLHPSRSLRNERFNSKSVDQKRPRFCTSLKRGKGETEDAAAAKKTLNVVPVIMLHRDKTKGVWNRKANQKECDHGRRGCCFQHWVSVLENNDRIFHADGRKALSARANLSPVPKGKFAATATQKLKVQGERCRPLVARSFDLSSSPLSSLKAIVNEMSRPQSASLPKRSNSFSTARSASTTCKSGQKPSIAITPARKLNNPELNSSAWLLAKMEALRNETFTEPKALQIAKEHGIVLDKEDEAALKKFLQSEQSPRLDRSLDASELEGHKTREKYFNLSNIKLAESAVTVAPRKLKKQSSPKAQSARIRECCKNSKSDPLVASDHNSQVCSKPGDLNMDDAPVFPNEVHVWSREA